jgi:hypothetical protein
MVTSTMPFVVFVESSTGKILVSLMLLPAVISVLAGLVLVGCARDGERAQLVAYHLEEHWAESAPPARRKDLTIPSGAHVVSCGPPAAWCPGVPEIPRRTVYYALTGEPELKTSDFAVGSARATFSQSGEPVVHVRLAERGHARFRTLTRRIAQAGRREGRLHHLALVVDDRLVTFPTIDYQTTLDGIDSDVVEITGLTGMTEANELAKALRED